MKIYVAITKSGMYCSASKLLMDTIHPENRVALVEWEVKTQGKSFHEWSRGRYVYDFRKK